MIPNFTFPTVTYCFLMMVKNLRDDKWGLVEQPGLVTGYRRNRKRFVTDQFPVTVIS